MKEDIECEQNYILYGASFDPPHMGHFSAIQQMLEKFDKVIVFPYPHKHESRVIERIMPLKQRMEMLEIFLNEFFPQIHDRLILVNLSSELKQKDKTHEGVFHTYDYLSYLKTKVKDNVRLSVCLGIDAQSKLGGASFYKEQEIKKDFGIFYLEEEAKFNSKEIRDFFKKKKVIRDNNDESFVLYSLGHKLTEYICKNNFYGLKMQKKARKVKMRM